MKRLVAFLLQILATCFLVATGGCSSEQPPQGGQLPQKSTSDKLDSLDRTEREEGLDEADQKYGVGEVSESESEADQPEAPDETKGGGE